MKRLFAVLTLLLAATPFWAQNAAYTNIKSITVTPLSNGVQILVLADGLLQFRDADTSGRKMGVFFPDARNATGKNNINVNRYPLAFLQLSTPQGARNGIGVRLDISNLAETNASATRTPDGQGLLFSIQSDRTIPQGRDNTSALATATQANPDAENATRVTGNKSRVSLHAVKSDVHELMAALARQSGIAIAVDDEVKRSVSLHLENIAPEKAVQTVAAAYGLALAPINGVLMLSEGVPTDLATYRASQTQSFRIQNTQAGTVSGLLPNFLSFYVKVNSEQNAVVVTAPSQMLAKIGADLKEVDVPSPQIAVEALAVEFSDTSDLDVGLRLGNPNAGQFASADIGSGTLSYNTIGTLPRNFEASLKALELKGRARVRARPQMVVVNGARADLFIGTQRFILTQFNQSGQTQNRIQPVDVGVKLGVSPLTGGNGEITARISPEVSNITELDLLSGLPVLSTRRSETSVRVKDGETIAIGGLTLDQQQIRKGKTPFFGDLPLVGKLFGTRKKTTVKTELVIFITPRILKTGDSPVVGLTKGALSVK